MDWTNLSSLLWLLAIGGLFYWMMMKGGCGGHGGHAHGGGHRAGGEAAKGAAGSSHEAHGANARDPEGYARRASETGQVSPVAPTRHHFRAGR